MISDLFSAPPRSDKQSTAAQKRCLGRNFSGHEPLPGATSRLPTGRSGEASSAPWRSRPSPPPHLAARVGLRKGSRVFQPGCRMRVVRPTQTSPPPAVPAAPETGRARRGARLPQPSGRGRARSCRSARPPCAPSPLPGTDLRHKGAAAAARRSPVLPAESRPRQHRDGVAQASDASACCSRDGPCRRRPLCAGRGEEEGGAESRPSAASCCPAPRGGGCRSRRREGCAGG